MKTMKSKKAMLTATCLTLVTLMMLTFGAWSASAAGFLATGKTVAEIESTWGKPAVTQIFNDGTEQRYYKTTSAMSTVSFRTFVFKDGKSIDDGSMAVSTPEPQRVEPSYKVVLGGR